MSVIMLQAEQRWVIPQTVLYSEQRNWKQILIIIRKQETLKNELIFHLDIDVRKEKEDSCKMQ